MATIKDVARACGLSAATVSYVLNDSRNVRPETRERVMRAVQNLNYHPSAIARGLSRKRMDTIGVMFPRTADSPISDPYYSLVLDGILSAAVPRRQNAMLFIGSLYADADSSRSIMRDGRCDGFIMISPHEDTESLRTLRESGVPSVVVGYRDDPELSRVDVDDIAAERDGTEQVIRAGHRRIGFVTHFPPETATFARERIDGWRSAMQAAKLPVEERWEWIGPEAWGGNGAKIADALAAMPPEDRPTALLVATDNDAIVLLRRLQERGLRVPEDISLVGFDDTNAAAGATPPLATIRQPLREVGAAALEMLLERIERPDSPASVHLLSTQFVPRASLRSLA